jgi:hypothetical protein
MRSNSSVKLLNNFMAENPQDKLATPELKVSPEESVAEIVCAEENVGNRDSELHSELHRARGVTCAIRWDDMEGESCVRQCTRCGLEVFDLSNGSSQDVDKFLSQTKSRSTTKLWRRSDGRYVRGECLATPLDVIPSIIFVIQSIFGVIGFPFTWKYAPIAWLVLPLWAVVAFGADILAYLPVHPTYGWLLLADLAWISFGYLGMSRQNSGWSRLCYVLGFYATGSFALIQPTVEKLFWLITETLRRQTGLSDHPRPMPTAANFPGFDRSQGLMTEFYVGLLLFGLFFWGLNAVVSKLRNIGTK